MVWCAVLRLVVVAVIVMAAAGPSSAQYDRSGRYVPSPMGVPADPYARVVPSYPGTPGRVTGTPVSPPPPEPLKVPPLTTRRLDPTAGTYSAPLVPLTADQCKLGWSVETNIPRVEFNRRCRRMRAKAPAE